MNMRIKYERIIKYLNMRELNMNLINLAHILSQMFDICNIHEWQITIFNKTCKFYYINVNFVS